MDGEQIKEKILRLLSKNDYGLTIEEVARSLEINRMTASKYLAILEATRKITVREVGKAKLHYPKAKGNRKWLKLNNYKSSCGLNGISFAFLLFLFFTSIIFLSAITTANPNGGNQNFEISVTKDYTEKLIILEIQGPPLTDFSMTLINPENRSISPKDNVSFRTDQEGKYELHLIGFVPGYYLVKLESNGTEYTKDFEIESFVESECNRSFLEYRPENATNVTETNESVAGDYVWDICRDFVESNVTKEEVITGIVENRSFVESENVTNETIERSFVEEELNITEITENRTFLENESVTNETVINETLERTFVEQELNITEIAENMTFVERELNITNITETNESIPRLFIEKVVEFLPEKKNFRINDKPRFKFTSKKIFSEQGKLIEEFAEPEIMNVFVYGPDQKLLGIKTDILKLGSGEYEIELSKGRAFRPGLYRIRMEVNEGLETYEMEDQFLWGVLAINTHKSVYLENEEAFIGIAVLDNEGHMICDAYVTLEITDPQGITTTLTTSEGTIQVSPQCEFYGVTNLPDYYAYYTVNTEGTYTMNLKAITRYGERTMVDMFEVRKQVDFDVERNGPTRIYPPAKYQMVFTIKANKDFEGEIKEYVPSGFEITPQDGLTITTSGDTKTLTWNEKLTTGETYAINYEFDAPDVSPYLFTLGALEIGNWKEARQWMIASDAYVEEYFIDTYVSSVDVSRTSEDKILDGRNNLFGTIEQIGNNAEYHYDIEDTTETGVIPNVNSVRIFIKHVFTELSIINDDVTMSHELGSTSITWSDELDNYPMNVRTDNITITSDVSTWYWENITDLQIDFTTVREGGKDDFKHSIDSVWVKVNYSGDSQNPTASIGTNPTAGLVDTDGSITFDLKCSDDFGVDTLQLWGNWSGSWSAKETNSNPGNDTWWNITVSGIPEGTWKWDAWCNDTSNNVDWSDVNRTFTINPPPSVKNVAVTPQKVKNYTNINITANITDTDGVCIARAMLYHPNGTFWQNLTMTNSGDIYSNETVTVSFYPHGTYNVTIWANDTAGIVNSTETTWFAPYLNLSKEKNITINGSFTDWSGVTVVTDNGTDAGGEGIALLEIAAVWGGGGTTATDGTLSVYRYNQTSSDYEQMGSNISMGTGYISVGRFGIGQVDNRSNRKILLAHKDSINLVRLFNWTGTDWDNFKNKSSTGPNALVTGDLIGDSTEELAFTDGDDDAVYVYTWNGTDWEQNFSASMCTFTQYAIAIGNVDGDDENELLFQGTDCSKIVVFDVENGQYVNNYNISWYTPGILDDFGIGDTDGDGTNEVVACGGSTNFTLYEWNGAGYTKIWEIDMDDGAGTTEYTQSCEIGNIDEDSRDELVGGVTGELDKVMIFENDSGTMTNTFNLTGMLAAISDTRLGDLDGDGEGEIVTFDSGGNLNIYNRSTGDTYTLAKNITEPPSVTTSHRKTAIGDLFTGNNQQGGGGDFDITNMSLANNDSYLFARLAVNGSIDLSEAAKYYRVFISINDSTGNETTPENENLPFKYDYRVQVNGSSCYVFNYSDYANNISSCLFNYSGSEMEVAVNLSVINLSAEENANISFQTGSTNPGGYDSAPDGESFLSYDVPVEAITTSLGTNPVPGYGDADGSIVFDLKCSDFAAVGLDTLQLWGNWSGWHANQTNSSPVNNTWWNVTVNGIPEGTWKWDAWCNNTIGQEDWSNVNRIFVVDLTDPQIGSKYINESGSMDTDAIVCMNVSGVSDNLVLDTVWTTVTQSNGSVFNITMSDTGSCAGSPGDNWYSADVNVGDSNGKFYYNTTYVNDSSGRINSNTTVLNLTVQFIDNTPTASLGTNPIAYYNDSDGSIVFDLKCSDDVDVSSLKLYGNWSGWHANQTNSTPGNNVWWNVTVNNIPEGTWKWDAWCNDTIGQEDWSDVNRTFTVNLSCKYPASGNWNISNKQSCSNITITMNGNLTVQNNGNLTFRNVTLKMNSSSDGQYGIKVQSGGAFYIYDNDDDKSTTSDASNITAVNTNYEFFFIVDSGSTFSMTNSQLSESGWWISVGQKGLEINTTVTEFSGNTLTNNANGVVFYSNNNIISNNTATSNGFYYGIYLPTSSNNTLTNNTVNSNYHGIYLGDSSNNTLTNNTVNSNSRGIYLDNSSNNTLTNNTANSNSRGIYLDDSSNNTLTNNTANSNSYGIYLDDSSNNTLTNNTVTSNIRGIISYLSDNNNITQNSISENLIDTETSSSSNILFYNNAFTRNIKSAMISVSTTNQTPAINGLAEFNISVSYPNGTDCSDFTYNITTRPYETVNASTNGNNIIGNFTATRPGLYSLIINVTDSNNNTVKTNYPFLVNTTEAVVNYYFRDIDPTHGQPKGSDSRSLLLTPPTTEESWSCGGWIQGYPDDLTVYTPHFIKDINMSFWYKVGTTNNYTGVQRYGTYGGSKDYSQSVPSAATYTWINRNFAVNWSMDYAKSWYWLSVKLTGSTPVWMTNETNPSYVNISYLYTTTPEIKNNTNTDILILSATSPSSNTNNATIYLDGTGLTNLTVQMLNTTITYSAKMDGNDCNDANCNLASQANGELNFSLSLGSEHNITIEGYVPPVASLGTNPVVYYNDSDGSITFDLKCSDDVDVSSLKLYGNWSGWHANQTNSSPGNDAWWNKTVSGIPEGVWKWDAWCNDTGGYEDWSAVNRTFTVDLTNPQIGSKYINESGSVNTDTIVCLNVSGVSDTNLETVWTTVTQSNGSVFNITMSDTGSCAGSPGDNWYSADVNVGDSGGTFFYNTTYVNDSSGRMNSNTTVLNLTVESDTSPVASLGTNPVPSLNDSDGSITFDLKCNDDNGADTLKLYGNWSGWHANQTNSSPDNNVWWNVTVSGIPEGVWKWDAWCNDTIGQEDWSEVNRTFTVNFSLCTPPTDDDWNITDSCTKQNEVITIAQNKSLHVKSGGSLTLINVTLLMNLTADGNSEIRVWSGGEMNITDNNGDGSLINSTDASYEFAFIVDSGSTFAMKNSLLSEAGWNWETAGQRGLEINTTVKEFSGNTLTYNYYGVTFYSDNNIISNNSASSNYGYGIYLLSSSNNTLTNNTASSNYGYGIYLLSSSNNNLTNNNASSNMYGIYLTSSSNNTLSNNTASSNDYYGIYLTSSSNNTLSNNTASSNMYGIYLTSSSNNTLSNNTASSNDGYGIYLTSSSNNNLTQNTISDNLYDLSDDANNIYSFNKFIHNINNKMINVSISNQTPALNGLVEFNISVFYPNGTACTDFSYNIMTRPDETVNTSTNENNITGNFTVTRQGFYSLIINNITDSLNNTVKRNYIVLANSTAEKIIDYYFRGVEPTHGQPGGSDAKSLLFTLPTSEESWMCSSWIQASPDDLGVFIPTIIKNINISTWYKVGRTDSYMGVQRYATYNADVDYSETVPEATDYEWITRNFTNLNWTMDYVKTWYWLALKLKEGTTGNPGDPYWKTNETNPSYVNITYNYTTTPEIKSTTNTDILILSATSPATDTNNATIYLDGTGSTNLTVQMPNTTINYSAKMDGSDCNDANCNLASQANGELNFSLSLGSEHNITIEGYVPPVASLGTNPVVYYNDSDGSITFDLKCSDDNGVDTLQLWGNWSGWHANQTNSSPGNDAWWNKTVSGIPEGVWKWDAWCNDTGGYEDWSDVNRTFTVDLNNPTASMGTNPVDYLNDSDGSIIFDLKCSDNFAVDTLQLWGNWTGTWEANQTNSTPQNDTFWNKTVSGIPAGTWKWGVYCNDSSGRGDWSTNNRTLTVDLTDPQIGNKYINESGSVDTDTIVCLNVSGISDNIGVDTVWTTVTQSNGSIFNVTMLDDGDCAGVADDEWYSVNVNVGNSSGTFYYNTTYVNDSSGRMNSNTTVLNLTVSACNVDFTMTSQLQAGIRFSEQDPSQVNVSAVDNGDYNVTDSSTSECGTVNVSIRATDDLVNGSSVIGIGNVTVNSTSPGSETIQLSTTYQLIRSSVPAGTSNVTTLYFWLTIPSGQDPKAYNTTIYIMEEME